MQNQKTQSQAVQDPKNLKAIFDNQTNGFEEQKSPSPVSGTMFEVGDLLEVMEEFSTDGKKRILLTPGTKVVVTKLYSDGDIDVNTVTYMWEKDAWINKKSFPYLHRVGDDHSTEYDEDAFKNVEINVSELNSATDECFANIENCPVNFEPLNDLPVDVFNFLLIHIWCIHTAPGKNYLTLGDIQSILQQTHPRRKPKNLAKNVLKNWGVTLEEKQKVMHLEGLLKMYQSGYSKAQANALEELKTLGFNGSLPHEYEP